MKFIINVFFITLTCGINGLLLCFRSGNMKTCLILNPGRKDEENRTRVKTVEIIVGKKAWPPPPRRFADDGRVPVRIAYVESDKERDWQKRMEGDGIRKRDCGSSRLENKFGLSATAPCPPVIIASEWWSYDG
jgi:hypothetical protein